jgi:hypothetical protein
LYCVAFKFQEKTRDFETFEKWKKKIDEKEAKRSKKRRKKNMIQKALLLALLLATMLAMCSAQVDILSAGSCEPFDSRLRGCQALLSGSMVWTAPPLGATQESLEAQLYNVNALTNSSIMDPITAMPHECASLYLRLFCGTTFQRCTDATLPSVGLVAVPHAPCKSVCRDMNAACATFFASLGLGGGIDCDRESVLVPGTEQWPDDYACSDIVTSFSALSRGAS